MREPTQLLTNTMTTLLNFMVPILNHIRPISILNYLVPAIVNSMREPAQLFENTINSKFNFMVPILNYKTNIKLSGTNHRQQHARTRPTI